MTEDEIRTRLTQNTVLIRRIARQKRELDQRWHDLMAESIALRYQLDQFAIYHLNEQ